MFRNSSQPCQYIPFTHFELTVSVPVTIFGLLKQSLFSAIFSSPGEVTHHQESKKNKFSPFYINETKSRLENI